MEWKRVIRGQQYEHFDFAQHRVMKGIILRSGSAYSPPIESSACRRVSQLFLSPTHLFPLDGGEKKLVLSADEGERVREVYLCEEVVELVGINGF